MAKIKVSVIVPVYNAEKYIERCVNCLVNQTLNGVEPIFVNDGAKDNSYEMLLDFQKKYPQIKVFTKENGGQGSARNLAIEKACGEYLGFVDVDDFADLTMFEIMYAKAKEGDYDAVFCDHYEIKGEKKTYKKFCDISSKASIFKNCLVSPWNKIIKREVYLNSGVTFPEGLIYEDTAWFANLIPFLDKIGKVDLPLFNHVVNENSTMTTRQEERTANIFPVMDNMLSFYKEKGLLNEYKEEVEYFYARILLLSSLARISKIRNKTLRKELALKSIRKVKENFPNYKNNKYLSGLNGFFIKSISESNINFFCLLLKLKG